MLKLIRLEWSKNHITKYIRNAIILAGLICLFLFAQNYMGIARDPDTGMPDTAPGYNSITTQVELFSSIGFLIFTSVMLSSFIVSAYKNKTMNLMFSYPIKRQKIVLSQMLAVWIFNVIALVLTKLINYGIIVFFSHSMQPDFIIDYNMGELSFYLQLVLKSVVTITMGFISLFIGLVMKSSKATVISAFLLILLTQANIGDFTLAGNAIVPCILMIISLVCAYLSIQNVETKDLM